MEHTPLSTCICKNILKHFYYTYKTKAEFSSLFMHALQIRLRVLLTPSESLQTLHISNIAFSNMLAQLLNKGLNK